MIMRFNGTRPADWTMSLVGVLKALDEATGYTPYEQMRYKSGSVKAINALRVLIPYTLMTMHDIPDKWIWLNRYYKPLGTWANTYDLRYQTFTNLHVDKNDPRIADIVNNCHEVYGSRYLFTDKTSPFANLKNAREYHKKLLTIKGLGEIQ